MSIDALAVIAARGGSKGIPRKNLRTVGGVPLVARTVQATLLARSIGRVVVSTEDSEIANVAIRYGAEVVWRPEELATDDASSESAWLHVLVEIWRTKWEAPEIVVALQCTSPFTAPEDIDGTVDALLWANADCAFSVERWHSHLWRPGGVAVGHDPHVRLRRQDQAPTYRETGAVYAMRRAGFLTARHRVFGRVAMHEVPAERSMEIDTEHDLRVAQALAEMAVTA